MSHNPAGMAALLDQWVAGDPKALATLAPLVYDELRRLARAQLKSERAGHTLQSSALVNEAFLRLLAGQPPRLQNREHFMAVAARSMRQVLVQHTRSRQAAKRNGGCRIALEELPDMPAIDDEQFVRLDDALTELARLDPRQAQVIEMKFFGGLSASEVSQVLGVSVATVERDWATARIWLRREMNRNAVG